MPVMFSPASYRHVCVFDTWFCSVDETQLRQSAGAHLSDPIRHTAAWQQPILGKCREGVSSAV